MDFVRLFVSLKVHFIWTKKRTKLVDNWYKAAGSSRRVQNTKSTHTFCRFRSNSNGNDNNVPPAHSFAHPITSIIQPGLPGDNDEILLAAEGVIWISSHSHDLSPAMRFLLQCSSWPPCSISNSLDIFSYNILFFFLTYVLPMLGMAVCYTQMGRNLWTGNTLICQQAQY